MSNEATLNLHVTYPATYPDVAPHLTLSTPSTNTNNNHHDIRPSSSSFLPPSSHAGLLAALEPTMAENLGMPMIFTLVSSLKDSAEQMMRDGQAVEQAQRDQKAQEAEAEENRRFEGERVTREGFLRWREGFMRERLEIEKEREREELESGGGAKGGGGKKEDVVKKLTGRELWERGLVGKGVDEDLLLLAGGEDPGEVVVVDDDVPKKMEKMSVET